MSVNAQWIGPPAPGDYSTVWYRYTLDLDASVVDISTFSLPIGINVDDSLYHIYINDVEILGGYVAGAHFSSISPYPVTLDQGWKDGENQVVIVTYNSVRSAALLIQQQPGGTGAPLCTAKASATAVPTLDRSAYWLTGLGILALAGFAARRRRAAR
jgi:hypothetical protein